MEKNQLDFILDVLQENAGNSDYIDWYSVFGFLELNKVSVCFYNKLKTLNYSIPPTVKRKLINLQRQQSLRNDEMAAWCKIVSKELEQCQLPHAFLKGSILSSSDFIDHKDCAVRLYNAGERISNDIDILINQKDISKVNNILTELGFEQGYWDFNINDFVKLSRSEIISRRMNRGETAPYILKLENGIVDFIEIDINFSLDHLPNGQNVGYFLSDVNTYSNSLCGLEQTKFFLHLILHQYKEARVLSMVKRSKENELYKYYDIYLFIKNDLVDFTKLLEVTERYDLQNECYFVLQNTIDIFNSLRGNSLLMHFINTIKTKCSVKMHEIIDPEDGNRIYLWKQINIRYRLMQYDNTKEIEKTDYYEKSIK